MTTKYYWDSCCFISRIQRDSERVAELEFITDEAAKDRFQIVTSAVSVAEVCYIQREGDESQREADAKQIALFFDNPYSHVRQVTRKIAEAAAQISRKTGAKPPDAIHLATAIDANTQIVHTYDDKMLKLGGKVGNPPLTIVSPASVERQPLLPRFDETSLQVETGQSENEADPS